MIFTYFLLTMILYEVTDSLPFKIIWGVFTIYLGVIGIAQIWA